MLWHGSWRGLISEWSFLWIKEACTSKASITTTTHVLLNCPNRQIPRGASPWFTKKSYESFDIRRFCWSNCTIIMWSGTTTHFSITTLSVDGKHGSGWPINKRVFFMKQFYWMTNNSQYFTSMLAYTYRPKFVHVLQVHVWIPTSHAHRLFRPAQKLSYPIRWTPTQRSLLFYVQKFNLFVFLLPTLCLLNLKLRTKICWTTLWQHYPAKL